MNTEKLLENVKNTPLLEPELYAILTDPKDFKKVSKVVTEVLKRSEKQISDFKKEDLAVLFRKTKERIVDYKDDDEVYKSTPKTENLIPLSFMQDEELSMMLIDITKMDNTDVDGYQSKAKQMEDFVWENCNLKKEDLTEWEQGLVEGIYLSGATNMMKTALGQEVGN